MRTLLDNFIWKEISSELLIFACELITPFTPLISGVCPGIIRQQYDDAIFPVLFQELLGEVSLCTFLFEVCDMDKWEKQDVNKLVFDIVNSKSETAKKNNFVQNLYD